MFSAHVSSPSHEGDQGWGHPHVREKKHAPETKYNFSCIVCIFFFNDPKNPHPHVREKKHAPETKYNFSCILCIFFFNDPKNKV